MKRVSLIDSIVEEIKNKITRGELKDGDTLGSQDELARKLEVSRPTLREALKRLELMGLIETKHGRGTFVKTVNPQDFMNPLSSFLVIDKESALELMEARLYIEGAVAALSARNAGTDDIGAIRNALDNMRTAAGNADVEAFIDYDIKFHILVARSTNNRVLIKTVDILRDLIHQLVLKVFEIHTGSESETFSHTIQYHEQILSAIEQHDARSARSRMEAHLRDVVRKVKSERHLK